MNRMNRRRVSIRESYVAAFLVLLAGMVAYLAYAAGGAGPLAVFGRADANSDVAQSWVQFPVHAGLAVGLALAGGRGLRWLAGAAGVAGVALLFIWMAFLTIVVLASLGDYTDPADLLACVSLLLIYGGVLYFTLRLEPLPIPTA